MRRPLPALLLSYASFLCLAIAATLSLSLVSPSWIGWLFVVLAVATLVITIRTRTTASYESDALLRAQSTMELLQVELAQQESAIDSMADGLDIAIFICNSEGTIMYANKRAREMFRFDVPRNKSILGVTLSFDLEQLVLKVLRNGFSESAEISFTHPEERVGRATAWKKSPSGQLFLSIYEITDLKRLERIRQDFVSNVSHELRTPLTIIRASAETIKDEPKTSIERVKTMMDQITDQVDRLTLISGDLLILSAAESNPVRKNACNLASVWRSSVANLQPSARSRHLEIEFIGKDKLLVEANETQMTQVAINLIENAINYTSEGLITVELSEETEDAVVRVKDTGIGISSEHQQRIFERFYRVDKGRSRATGGTGLGLSIVKHIVEAHGGKIAVTSTLNQGSTFEIRIPIGNPISQD